MVILLILMGLMLLIHLTGQTNNGGEIDNAEIMITLKYLSNFCRTLEMPLINCEVILF